MLSTSPANLPQLSFFNVIQQIDVNDPLILLANAKKEENAIPEYDLIILRSPHLNTRTLTLEVSDMIYKIQKPGMLKPYEPEGIAEQIFSVMCQNLIEGGEIFYFDSGFYNEGR